MLTDALFSHVNDPDWIELRESYWQEWVEEELKSYHGYTKKQIKVMKAYYQSGNIEALFNDLTRMKEPLEIYEVLDLTPFHCKTEFDYIVHYYCEYYFPEHLNSDAIPLERTQRYIREYLIGVLCGGGMDGMGNPFAVEMSNAVFGNKFKQKIKYPESFPLIGQLALTLNPNVVFRGLMFKITGYMFNKIKHVTSPVSATTVDYFLSLLPLIDVYPFTLTLLERPNVAEQREYEPYFSQNAFRVFFTNVYGYAFDYDEESEFGFFTPELQADIKTKIENMALGEGFDALIDMIHRHKGQIMYVSE